MIPENSSLLFDHCLTQALQSFLIVLRHFYFLIISISNLLLSCASVFMHNSALNRYVSQCLNLTKFAFKTTNYKGNFTFIFMFFSFKILKYF